MKPKLRTALYFAGAIIIAALISAGVTMQLYNQNRKDAVMLSTDEYAALTDILALDEIISDMESQRVMSRLVQGDVGSGKTIVAEAALFACVRAGYQGAMMAPTEVLAKQHYEEFKESLGKYGIRCACLVGSTGPKDKRRIYESGISFFSILFIYL